MSEKASYSQVFHFINTWLATMVRSAHIFYILTVTFKEHYDGQYQ